MFAFEFFGKKKKKTVGKNAKVCGACLGQNTHTLTCAQNRA